MQYHGGVWYHEGYHDACGGYLEYCGGCSVPWGISWVLWGYLKYCGGYHHAHGGYYECHGGGVFSIIGDTIFCNLSTVEGYQDTCGG